MPQTIEAEIAADGTVRLLGPFEADGRARRAVVTVLDEPAPTPPSAGPLTPIPMPVPPDQLEEFMRRLRALASDCGPPPPGTTYSSEEIYD